MIDETCGHKGEIKLFHLVGEMKGWGVAAWPLGGRERGTR